MCPLCMKFEDTQKHCIECPKLKSVRDQFKEHINYDHIFSSCELEQQAVASLFLNILETRQRLIQEGLPGTWNTGPDIVLLVWLWEIYIYITNWKQAMKKKHFFCLLRSYNILNISSDWSSRLSKMENTPPNCKVYGRAEIIPKPTQWHWQISGGGNFNLQS